MTVAVLSSSLANIATVATYGPNRPPNDRLLALPHGAKHDMVCLKKAASTNYELGFQTVVNAEFGPSSSVLPDVNADAVIATKPGTGIVTWRADCASVVFVINDHFGKKSMAVVHAGRYAMTPTNQPGEPIRNIITITHEALIGKKLQPQVHAYITGSICGHHFTHEGPEGEELVKPFDQFGSHAFVDRNRRALDLVAIIKQQLIGLGVSRNRIYADNICTYESPNLASYRRDKNEDRNLVVAVLH